MIYILECKTKSKIHMSTLTSPDFVALEALALLPTSTSLTLQFLVLTFPRHIKV